MLHLALTHFNTHTHTNTYIYKHTLMTAHVGQVRLGHLNCSQIGKRPRECALTQRKRENTSGGRRERERERERAREKETEREREKA